MRLLSNGVPDCHLWGGLPVKRFTSRSYKTIRVANGIDAPWYMIPFDKHGNSESPATIEALEGAKVGRLH